MPRKRTAPVHTFDLLNRDPRDGAAIAANYEQGTSFRPARYLPVAAPPTGPVKFDADRLPTGSMRPIKLQIICVICSISRKITEANRLRMMDSAETIEIENQLRRPCTFTNIIAPDVKEIRTEKCTR
jgi:hypothetical protein